MKRTIIALAAAALLVMATAASASTHAVMGNGVPLGSLFFVSSLVDEVDDVDEVDGDDLIVPGDPAASVSTLRQLATRQFDEIGTLVAANNPDSAEDLLKDWKKTVRGIADVLENAEEDGVNVSELRASALAMVESQLAAIQALAGGATDEEIADALRTDRHGIPDAIEHLRFGDDDDLDEVDEDIDDDEDIDELEDEDEDVDEDRGRNRGPGNQSDDDRDRIDNSGPGSLNSGPGNVEDRDDVDDDDDVDELEDDDEDDDGGDDD